MIVSSQCILRAGSSVGSVNIFSVKDCDGVESFVSYANYYGSSEIVNDYTTHPDYIVGDVLGVCPSGASYLLRDIDNNVLASGENVLRGVKDGCGNLFATDTNGFQTLTFGGIIDLPFTNQSGFTVPNNVTTASPDTINTNFTNPLNCEIVVEVTLSGTNSFSLTTMTNPNTVVRIQHNGRLNIGGILQGVEGVNQSISFDGAVNPAFGEDYSLSGKVLVGAGATINIRHFSNFSYVNSAVGAGVVFNPTGCSALIYRPRLEWRRL